MPTDNFPYLPFKKGFAPLRTSLSPGKVPAPLVNTSPNDTSNRFGGITNLIGSLFGGGDSAVLGGSVGTGIQLGATAFGTISSILEARKRRPRVRENLFKGIADQSLNIQRNALSSLDQDAQEQKRVIMNTINTRYNSRKRQIENSTRSVNVRKALLRQLNIDKGRELNRTLGSLRREYNTEKRGRINQLADTSLRGSILEAQGERAAREQTFADKNRYRQNIEQSYLNIMNAVTGVGQSISERERLKYTDDQYNKRLRFLTKAGASNSVRDNIINTVLAGTGKTGIGSRKQ